MCDCLPQLSWIANLWKSPKHKNSEPGTVDESSGLLANSPTPIAPPFPNLPPRLSINTAPEIAGQSLGRTQAAGTTSPLHLGPPSSKKPPNKWNDGTESVTTDEPASYPASLTSTQFEPGTPRSRSQSHSRLQDDLSDSLEEWPRHGTQRFLPVNHFERLITPESITLELEEVSAKSAIGLPSTKLVEKIFKRFPKLFAILVLTGLTEFIYDFVKEDLCDKHLPYRIKGRDLFSKFNPVYKVQCTEVWSRTQVRQFGGDQWSLTAPIFKRTPDIEHYIIDHNQVLPFIYDASEDPTKVKRGGFGEVYKVIIHPAHQLLSGRSASSKGLNPAFAVKRLFVKDKAEFDREVEMLKSFGGDRHHSHLAELVATYEYRGHFHLIFPFAKCDLRSYWKRTPCPEFSHETVDWFLCQVKGLSSAIHKIHGYKVSFDDSQNSAERNTVAPSLDKQTSEMEPPHCCIHGDIKAENILWSDEDSRDDNPLLNFAGVLILTDFGQMRKYKIQTELRKPLDEVAETPAYAPPEATNPIMLAQPSRTSDIWSLGCVYLEFTIWLLCDWEKLDKFTKERGATFHSKHKPDSEQRADEAVVNLCVQEWITTLHREPRCSKFIHHFLGLISKMLDVTPSKRIRSDVLNRELTTMLKRAKQEPEYLLRPCPTQALCCCRRKNNHESLAVENLRSRPKEGKEGTPLPLRPSVLHKQQEDPLQWVRAKRSTDYLWKVATKTRKLGARGSSNPIVDKWMRIVSTFHTHEAF